MGIRESEVVTKSAGTLASNLVGVSF